MKTTVISYSLTGNNDALASGIAGEFSAEHIKITESKPRTMGKTAFDILLNRNPKIHPSANISAAEGRIIFVGPVWMGHIATPLRSCIKDLKTGIDQYCFVSISGGADGPNPKLAEELTKRTGKSPAAVIDMHIADLLPAEPKPTRGDTSTYRLNGDEVKNLTENTVKTLRKILEPGR